MGVGFGQTMRTLLVADDHDDTREIIRLILELDGWRVFEASNGHVALERILSSALDMLVLDEMMPGTTGSEALRRARAAGVAIPAVLVTAAHDAPRDDPGFAAVVRKPFAPDELRSVVARVYADRGRHVAPAQDAGGAPIARVTVLRAFP
jgi:CheY-like chemotaxis protein